MRVMIFSLLLSMLFACDVQHNQAKEEIIQHKVSPEILSTPALDVKIEPLFIRQQEVINTENDKTIPINYNLTRAVTNIDWLDRLLFNAVISRQIDLDTPLDKAVTIKQQELEKCFLQSIKEAEIEDYVIATDYIVNTYYLGQRNNIATFMIENYMYTSGAHGYGVNYYLNFDLDKELLIQPELLVIDKKRLEALLWQQYMIYRKNNPFLNIKRVIVSDNFYFTPSGMVFSYKPYEIGSFAEGQIELLVSWKELKGIIHQDYLYTEKDGIYD